MEFYDIALQSCGLSAGQEAALGFKKIFLAGKDVALLGAGQKGEFSGAIVSGTNKRQLAEEARRGARALIIEDMRIDKSLMDTMAKKGTLLCMPLSGMMLQEGLERAVMVFLMRGLYSYARRRGLHVGFVSMAPSWMELCSGMQLVELARLICADEQYARYSVSAVNKAMVVGNED